MNMERIGIIGGGLMGSGIAEVCARTGSNVIVHEINAETAEAALGRIQKSLARAVERGKLDEAGRDDILTRVNISTDLSEQADRQLVIEAATENEGLKKQIFADLDRIVASDAILASNTSSIPITRLAAATNRPGQVGALSPRRRGAHENPRGGPGRPVHAPCGRGLGHGLRRDGGGDGLRGLRVTARPVASRRQRIARRRRAL